MRAKRREGPPLDTGGTSDTLGGHSDTGEIVYLQPEMVNGAAAQISINDFRLYMPQNRAIYMPDGALWSLGSIDARLPWPEFEIDNKVQAMPPSRWLAKWRPVEQITWMPGEPQLIRHRLISEGGWFDHPGATVFNQYRPPTIRPGDPAKAKPWLDHVTQLYPENAPHIIAWLAHRRQRPGEKVNHALVLGGGPGIGKDTILEAVKHAVGPWNMKEIAPSHLLGRFNSFIKNVVLRISEARDLGPTTQYELYERTKTLIAAPPDVLRCDEKNVREHDVPNVCGVIITTNYRTNGLYLPADDRRHYVCWSELTKEAFTDNYWSWLWRWYEAEGFRHVTAYLQAYDLSAFNPKAPPPKTAAFWAIVDAGRPPENAELADIVEELGSEDLGLPDALTIDDIAAKADKTLHEWLTDRKNSRQMPHRMEDAGYVAIRSPDREDGRWRLAGKLQTIYAKRELCVRDQIIAAQELCKARHPHRS